MLVVERSGIGAGASGVQPGGVRQQWGTRVNCLMARDSLRFYQRLGERLAPRVDPCFRACGYVFLAHSQRALALLAANVQLQNELGIPSRLLSPDQAGEVVPGLEVETIAGGSVCEEDGYFDRPQAVVEAFAEAAQRGGARVDHGDVARVAPDGGGWRLELADGRVLRASHVVVAAAHDSGRLLQGLGVELPIAKEARYLFLGDPVPERLLEPLVVSSERGFAAKQLAEGRLLASDLRAAGDPERDREVWRGRIREAVADLLPALEYVPLPLLVEGFYDTTPDHQALVGALAPYDGLWIAAGFSGHGFMMAPAVGAAVARLVAGEDAGELVGALSPERFARGALIPEPQVV